MTDGYYKCTAGWKGKAGRGGDTSATSSQGEAGKGTGLWTSATARQFFGDRRDRHGKTAVGRTCPEQQLGKESSRKALKGGKGVSDPLAAPKGHRLGLYGHIFQPTAKNYILIPLAFECDHRKVCRAATSCSPALPPQPGHYQSLFFFMGRRARRQKLIT